MAGEDEDRKTGDQAQQSEESAREHKSQEKTQQERDKAGPSKKEQDSQERKWR